jgi:membrane associated rhomboid family serine protease
MPVDLQEKQRLIRAAYIPALLLFIIWAIKGIEVLGDVSFSTLGVYPLKEYGLPGIILSPLIHADFNHLFNNSIPLVLLSTAIFYFYKPIAYKIIILIWLVTGLCVWLGGRPSYHIGASGLIYGFASFLFFSGVLRKNIKLMAISLLTIFLYGGMVWGVLPLDWKISWESHLFGSLAGLTFAFIYADEGPQKEETPEDEEYEYPFWEENEPEEPDNNKIAD